MTKRKVPRQHRSSMALWVAFIVVFMAELLVYSWCRVQYVQVGYEVAEAGQEYRRLRAVLNELKIEQAQLRSPERIRRIAQERGLIMPDPSQVVVIP